MIIRQNIRAYPTKEQEQFLRQDIGNQRFVWNKILAGSKTRYEQEQKFIFYNEASKLLPILKQEYDFLKLGGSACLQQTLRDLDQAQSKAIKDVKSGRRHFGFPKFKRKSSGGSVRYPQHCSLNENHLKIPKLGLLKVKNHLNISEFNSITILLKPSGQWYVSFVVKIPDVPKVNIQSVVGVDLNSRYLAVLSTGEGIENPKYLKKKEQRLKKYQRSMSRKVSGSKNRNKSRSKVARQHQHVANCRKDFMHKVTTDIARNHDFIAIEDLNVKSMQQWNGRMIQEANFGLFRTLITWKANKFGKTLVIIGRFDPTSKVCSSCGQLLKLTLKDRWIKCSCGCSLHRDHNAALNILKIGLHRAGMVQINACGDSDMSSSGLKWESLKQEAMSFRAW